MKRSLTLLFLAVCALPPLSAQATLDEHSLKEWLSILWEPHTDTLYARHSNRPFRIKIRTGATLDLLSFNTNDAANEVKLMSEPIFKVGAHISYRNIGIGFMRGIKSLFNSHKTQDTELFFSGYGRTVGGDIAYSNQQNYILTRYNSCGSNKRVQGVSNSIIYGNGYYVFNNRRFSYPAALTQSYLQKRSCGSIILGVSFYYNRLKMAPTMIPQEITENTLAPQLIEWLQRFCVNMNIGYAYNKVFTKNITLHASILPSLPIINNTLYCADGKTKRERFNPTLDIILRIALIWDKDSFFTSLSAILYSNKLLNSPIGIRETYTRTQLSFGIRF